MARDDPEKQRTGMACTSRYWRVGEQRAVVGGCLQAAFAAQPPGKADCEILALLGALDGKPSCGGER